MAAAAAAAARSAIRSSALLRNAVARRVAAEGGTVRPALRLPKQRPSAPRLLRYPVQTSVCVESLLPLHSATASALMTSLLSVSRRGYGWLSEGQDETR